MTEYWVEYWLQDGTQCSESIDVPAKADDDYEYIQEELIKRHKGAYGGIADYGVWE